jgi:hypothetical protein
MARIAYDPRCTTSYGYFKCPTCQEEFCDGGSALHADTCSEKNKGYEVCVYYFGPEMVKRVKEWAQIHGEESRVPPNNRLSLQRIKEECVPEALI